MTSPLHMHLMLSETHQQISVTSWHLVIWCQPLSANYNFIIMCFIN